MRQSVFMRLAVAICQRRYASSANTKRTCLYDLHTQHWAKMVPFAGYEMPVQYGDHTIADSTVHTRKHVSVFDVSHMLQTHITGKDRKHVSVFDVSHMLQTHITGKDRVEFIESLTTADVQGLQDNQGTLSVFTNERGGIKDDLIVTKTDLGYIYMVTNAGCIDKDLPYLLEKSEEWRKKGKDVEVKPLEGRGLVAVQGPGMAKLLQGETDFDLSKLYFMHSTVGTVFGIRDCRVTRCGYTGEDGVEISVEPRYAAELVENLLRSTKEKVRMAGLGARDALRLEAGLCLYGNDIDENTTPIEAGLAFVVAKRRRQTKDFPGAEVIVSQLEKKNWPKRRVGLLSDKGRAPRSHLPIIDPISKAVVGFVTSGCPSPNLKKNIGMAYVDKQDSKVGKELMVDFGGRQSKVTVTKMPFVPNTYYNPPK
uniref:Aminomethyltransferase n=1 Tax=Ascaris lumbricoides TaxID=6252 RepID=A0A0M3I5J0_ASCLU